MEPEEPFRNNPNTPDFTCGQKVVCINDRFPYAVFECFDDAPRKGSVYAVTEVRLGQNYCTGLIGLGVSLEECPSIEPKKACFNANRFRPLEPAASKSRQRETARTYPSPQA